MTVLWQDFVEENKMRARRIEDVGYAWEGIGYNDVVDSNFL